MEYVHKDEFNAFKAELKKTLANIQRKIEEPAQEQETPEPEIKEKKHRK